MKHGKMIDARTYVLSLLILIVSAIVPLYVYPVSAEVTGTAYTSPHHDYSITWQLPWYVIEDDTDAAGFDVLGLADDRSFVFFSGGISNAPNPASVVSQYARQMQEADEWSGFHALDEHECLIQTSADSAACYAGTQLFADGDYREVGVLLQAWDLGNGLDLLFEGYVEQTDFATYLQRWQTFAIYPPGAFVPIDPTAGCDSFEHDEIVYCFDPELPERDRSDITESVRLGRTIIAQYFGDPQIPGIRINGFTSVASDGDENLATTLDRVIAVYTGSRVWRHIAPAERVQTVVHEYFHVYQNFMTGDVRAAIPLWFTEGSAEAVGYLAAAQLGVVDQNDFYALAGYALGEFPIPETLADLRASGSMTADAYPLAYIAIQYLLGSRGLSIGALGDVYIELGNGATFEQAFSDVFSVSLDQFLLEFETWRPSFAKVDDLPRKFWPNDGTASPAAIALRSIPAYAFPDQQIVILADTEPLVECTANFGFGSESIDRQTFSDGAGTVFWLMTIPANAPAGPADITFSCGAMSISTTMTIGKAVRVSRQSQ